jgi:hypothetical protein
MNSPALVLAILSCSVFGCAKSEVAAKRGDLHPDTHVVVRISDSQYEENLSIGGDWIGGGQYSYTFNCESSSIERLIKFLHRGPGLSEPDVIGIEHLPTGLYLISFGDKTWRTKEDVTKEVTSAIETAFDLNIHLMESPRTLIIKK